MIKQIKARISINRRSNDTIHISIEDVNSRIEFFDGEMCLSEFAKAVTGLSCQEINADVRFLEDVGKKRITERRTIHCPLKSWDKEELRKWLVENAQEEGWILSDYLGSQGSVVYTSDGCTLSYLVTKFVDESEVKNG